VGHATDGSKRVVEDFMTAFTMEMGNGAHAAIIVFLGKLVE
jgi:hypothetical protein